MEIDGHRLQPPRLGNLQPICDHHWRLNSDEPRWSPHPLQRFVSLPPLLQSPLSHSLWMANGSLWWMLTPKTEPLRRTPPPKHASTATFPSNGAIRSGNRHQDHRLPHHHSHLAKPPSKELTFPAINGTTNPSSRTFRDPQAFWGGSTPAIQSLRGRRRCCQIESEEDDRESSTSSPHTLLKTLDD